MATATATTTPHLQTAIRDTAPKGMTPASIVGYAPYALCDGQKVPITTTDYDSYGTKNTPLPTKTIME